MTLPQAPLSHSTPPTQAPSKISLVGCTDVVAAIPYVLGFHPQNSLVLIAIDRHQNRWGLTARLDLPSKLMAPAFLADLHQSIDYLRLQPGSRLSVVLFGELPQLQAESIWRAVQGLLQPLLATSQAEILQGIYVSSTRLWAFNCSDSPPCPTGGVLLAEIDASRTRAEFVWAGHAPCASHREIQAALSANHSYSAELGAAFEFYLERFRQTSEPFSLRHPAAKILDKKIKDFLAGKTIFTSDHKAILIAAFALPELRDLLIEGFFYWILPGEPSMPPPSQNHRLAAEAVLFELIHAANNKWSVAPLAVLGIMKWAHGQGAWAHSALMLSQKADPNYTLAILGLRLIQEGVIPRWAERSFFGSNSSVTLQH